ncbi:MAG: ABC transporter permease [Fibrobacterota bacterium]
MIILRILRSILVGSVMAAVEMRAHKLRSALSILGVMLGVASLVAILTLIGGIDVFLNERMGKWAGSVWFWSSNDISEEDEILKSRSPGMRFEDGVYLEENVEEAEQFYRKIERYGRAIISGRETRANLRGIGGDVVKDELEHVVVQKGEPLSDKDYANGNRVCLISWRMEQHIQRQMRAGRHQDDESLVGKECLFKGVRFTIKGIFYPKDENFEPWHLRRAVVIPINTMKKYVTGFNPDPRSIQIRVRDAQKVKKQAERIAVTLTALHRGVQDFEYRTADWLDEITEMLDNMSLLMGIVSVVSLLVGGLSIMNVMLSSISERIQEIGIRKALGANTLQIFIQFIGESVTLSLSGGALGAVMGMAPLLFKDAIQKSTDGAIVPTILPMHMVLVFGIIVTVGVLFGLYPALKAARMNPIDALRYE